MHGPAVLGVDVAVDVRLLVGLELVLAGVAPEPEHSGARRHDLIEEVERDRRAVDPE